MTTLSSPGGSFTGSADTPTGAGTVQISGDVFTMPETGTVTSMGVYFGASFSGVSAYLVLWDWATRQPVDYVAVNNLPVNAAGAGNQQMVIASLGGGYVATRNQQLVAGFAPTSSFAVYRYSWPPNGFRFSQVNTAYSPEAFGAFSTDSGTLAWQMTYTPIAPGGAKIWNGTTWDKHPVKTWNGTAWQQHPVKTWDGSAWQSR